jgi:hypothetical protein
LGWRSPRGHAAGSAAATFALLVGGIAVAALSTISPGLGGIALLTGVWV